MDIKINDRLIGLDHPTRSAGASESQTLLNFSQIISPVAASAQTIFSPSRVVSGLARQTV